MCTPTSYSYFIIIIIIFFFFGSLNVWTISFIFILFLFVYKYSYLFVHELHTCVFHQNKWHKWLIFVQRGRIFPTFSYLLLFFLFTHHTIKHICSHMLYDSLPFVAVPILHCCHQFVPDPSTSNQRWSKISIVELLLIRCLWLHMGWVKGWLDNY